MHIGLVGGLDRSESQYRQLAERAGHSIEWHTGDLAGRGAGTLEALVERADLVIVVTAVNSHGAVWRARKLAMPMRARRRARSAFRSRPISATRMATGCHRAPRPSAMPRLSMCAGTGCSRAMPRVSPRSRRSVPTGTAVIGDCRLQIADSRIAEWRLRIGLSTGD